jgi:hypothetical protein
MKFETKYIIRWGFPGWVSIFFIGLFKIISHWDKFLGMISNDYKFFLTINVSLLLLGIPIGYLLYQTYFGILWVSRQKVKKGKYFELEYTWHSNVMSLEPEKMDYLSGRYRHLLGRIHDTGALLMSLVLSIVFIIVQLVMEWTLVGASELAPLIALLFFTFKNLAYYEENLNFFRDKFLDDYFTKNNTNEKCTEKSTQ